MKRKTVTFQYENQQITYELASFSERFRAKLTDILINIIPNSIIPVLVAWIYWASYHSSEAKATYGQQRLGLMVLDSTNGEGIGFGQASIRFFSEILNLVTLSFGYLMYFFNDKNQCLHDYLSGCIVVKKTIIETIETDDNLLDHLVE